MAYAKLIGEFIKAIGIKVAADYMVDAVAAVWNNSVGRIWAEKKGKVYDGANKADPNIGLITGTRASKARIDRALLGIGIAGNDSSITLNVPAQDLARLFPYQGGEQWDVVKFRTIRFLFEVFKQLQIPDNYTLRLVYWLSWMQQFTFIQAFQLPQEDNDIRQASKAQDMIFTDEWRLSVLEDFVESIISKDRGAMAFIRTIADATSSDGNSVYTYMWWFFRTSTAPETFRLSDQTARARNAWFRLESASTVLTQSVEDCLAENLMFSDRKGYQAWPLPSSTEADSGESLDAFKYLITNYQVNLR
jgi:hypothetical protein